MVLCIILEGLLSARTKCVLVYQRAHLLQPSFHACNNCNRRGLASLCHCLLGRTSRRLPINLVIIWYSWKPLNHYNVAILSPIMHLPTQSWGRCHDNNLISTPFGCDFWWSHCFMGSSVPQTLTNHLSLMSTSSACGWWLLVLSHDGITCSHALHQHMCFLMREKSAMAHDSCAYGSGYTYHTTRDLKHGATNNPSGYDDLAGHHIYCYERAWVKIHVGSHWN